MTTSALQFWLQQLESRHPVAIDLGLERVALVAERLQCRQFSHPVITVAGTNGKGSTVATLQSLALTHGLTVATYTSPHLLTFNERIALNGVAVSDDELVRAFERVEQARESISLTYFEFTTLAALVIFKSVSPDLIVLEVGMGGRLDAVNIVDADIAVITTIAKDHEAYLGNTVEAIATEKAGICRSHRPVVISDRDQISLIENAVQPYGAHVFAAGREFHWHTTPSGLFWSFAQRRIEEAPFQLGPDLIAGALTAFHLQFASRWSDEKVKRAITQANIVGRFQRIGNNPETIVDIGHNPQAASRLAMRIKASNKSKIRLVVGMLADKDQRGSLAAFNAMPADWYLADLQGARASKATDLYVNLAAEQQTNAKCFASPRDAWRSAVAESHRDDLIVVWGSFLTVADVMLAASGK